ncbi:MAG TPA: transporter [Ramlibacter sp.]|uniref:transporter n=1 Tax=Ramlibacter sp. TaxID=1917967 RepID=UPI002D7FA55D|nr:transporter [Ramlibacter sp.]HET8746423.1 transporter [Ramlibacter sp.]
MDHLSRSAARMLAVAAVSLTAAAAHASCGSAFCSINTDWATDALGLAEGGVLDLRYEYINQDQPRTGSRRIGVGEIPGHHHDEVSTANRNLLATYSRGFASGWGYSVTLPIVDRKHFHIHNHQGGQLPERWDFREIGDLRVTGRYQQPVGDGTSNAGVIFGLKLPTGRTGVSNDAGDEAERSLQPGSGTTDAIVGAFFHQQLSDTGSWFAQVQLQHPLNKHDEFAPGTQLTADLGYARRLGERFSGLLQLNAVVKQRDRGAEAEPDDSGSRSYFLSPGVSYDLNDRMRIYAFYQHPLHQNVNGVQLTAKRAIAVGIATRF